VVEKWNRDWMRVELMRYAGDDLDKARRMFEQIVRARPRIQLTILPSRASPGCDR
jgi:hypothetical protein